MQVAGMRLGVIQIICFTNTDRGGKNVKDVKGWYGIEASVVN